MNTKNDVEVIINGKQYTLSGYESSEYLQKIANHINDKIAEFKEQDGYLRLDTEMKNILLAINLSDEYYKALKDSNDIKKENEEMEKEIFDIKHEMLTMQSELDKANEQIKKLAEEKNGGKPIKVVANLPYYITTPIIMGLFICNNIIIQRFGIDEVKRIMTTSGIAYVVVGIIVSLLSLTINGDYVLTSNEVFNSLFGYDINNIRIFIGGFVSIMLMLWSSSYVYYYIRRSKNILWFSNIGTMLFIQMLESIIFVIISYIGEFDFTLLFGMIVIRYLIKIIIGMIGLIPVYTIVKMKDR